MRNATVHYADHADRPTGSPRRKPACRWSLDGAAAILRLRSLRASGHWEACWRHHEQREQARNHATRHANGAMPSLTPSVSPARRKVTTVTTR